MRVLLDECVNWRLGRDIIGHDVKIAHQMGWTTVQNGALLALAAQGLLKFDLALLETWHVFRRAGAAYVITYGARQAKALGL